MCTQPYAQSERGGAACRPRLCSELAHVTRLIGFETISTVSANHTYHVEPLSKLALFRRRRGTGALSSIAHSLMCSRVNLQAASNYS
jgi:hypothetical protein